MLIDLKEKVVQNTEIIESTISKYFANRLGVKDIKTINALGENGNLTFNQKVNLFCDIAQLSKIDKAKFKVFTQINNEILLNEDLLSSENDYSSINCYSPFLFNVYLNDDDVVSIKEKLNFAINKLMDDVVSLTVKQTKKPQVYYNKDVGIVLPE